MCEEDELKLLVMIEEAASVLLLKDEDLEEGLRGVYGGGGDGEEDMTGGGQELRVATKRDNS